ncbi:MAG: response regulator [Lachnospiraceae bacterium]|jgi:DNA-binding response OmpR family regulator|nr:response regulator [Lachnospiraceae bacterium]
MKHIAVVDDDEIYVKAICRMLVNEQRHVTGITSGKKLLDYAGVNDLDLVLLDIRMTEMDGFETLERLRKQEKESGKDNGVPVILITGEENRELEQKGYDLGASDYIRKPVEPSFLKERISNILNV